MPEASSSSAEQHYYREFGGGKFVFRVPGAVSEHAEVLGAIIGQMRTLMQHGIGCVAVFGGGHPMRLIQQRSRTHPDTSLSIISEADIAEVQGIQDESNRRILAACTEQGVEAEHLPPSIVRAELRPELRPSHERTGRVREVDEKALGSAINRGRLAVMGFGGLDGKGQYLTTSANEVAVGAAAALKARKLVFLSDEAEGVVVPDANGRPRKFSYLDLDAMLHLLTRRNTEGRLVLHPGLASKLRAAITALSRGVEQVHLIPQMQLLEEFIRDTGVGTLMEQYHTHALEMAEEEDLRAIVELHDECVSPKFATPLGIPYLKPLSQEELRVLLPHTLVLRHRERVIGKFSAEPAPDRPDARVLKAFAVRECFHDSQFGRVLLERLLERAWRDGCREAVSITSSPAVKGLFSQYGEDASDSEWAPLLDQSKQRYDPQEHDLVRLFRFLPPKE